uniref:Uncharacterized protein n=1 Tax=viral metagenome TaxID=1070528 RepID=A0A6H2A3Z3_9ZZZZ
MGNTLGEIATILIQKDAQCHWCGSRFDLCSINCYPHKDGIEVEGYTTKQWVYLRCMKCGYDWALWKLLAQIKERK